MISLPLRFFERLRRALTLRTASNRDVRNDREQVGRTGERLASAWLKRHGYTILERNRKVGSDEADIVALDPDGRSLVIVEVKTRCSNATPPEASINHRKQYHLTRLATRLLQTPQHKDRPVRFDVIAIVMPAGQKPTIRHIPGAFESRF